MTNKMTEIKSIYLDKVIFTSDCADLKGCVVEALEQGTNLSYADLSGTNLSGTNLSYADLSGTNLSGTNLSYADLSGTNLSGTNLSRTNLSGANLSDTNLSGKNLSDTNLSYADLSGTNLSRTNLSGTNLSRTNLSGTNLWNCIGNRDEIKSMQVEQYSITYTSQSLQIGCKQFKIEECWDLSNEQIDEINEGALEFWKKWKDTIKHIIEISPATPTKHEVNK